MYVDFVLCRTWHRNEQTRIRAPVIRLMSNKMQANFIILHNKQTRNWYTNKNVGSHSFVEARIRKIDRSIDANDHRILMQSKPTIYIYVFSMYQFNGKTILLLDYRFYFFFLFLLHSELLLFGRFSLLVWCHSQFAYHWAMLAFCACLHRMNFGIMRRARTISMRARCACVWICEQTLYYWFGYFLFFFLLCMRPTNIVLYVEESINWSKQNKMFRVWPMRRSSNRATTLKRR